MAKGGASCGFAHLARPHFGAAQARAQAGASCRYLFSRVDMWTSALWLPKIRTRRAIGTQEFAQINEQMNVRGQMQHDKGPAWICRSSFYAPMIHD